MPLTRPAARWQVADAFSNPGPDVPAGLVLALQRTVWCLDAPAAAQLLDEERHADHLYG